MVFGRAKVSVNDPLPQEQEGVREGRQVVVGQGQGHRLGPSEASPPDRVASAAPVSLAAKLSGEDKVAARDTASVARKMSGATSVAAAAPASTPVQMSGEARTATRADAASRPEPVSDEGRAAAAAMASVPEPVSASVMTTGPGWISTAIISQAPEESQDVTP
jgi:hypothetical protein